MNSTEVEILWVKQAEKNKELNQIEKNQRKH